MKYFEVGVACMLCLLVLPLSTNAVVEMYQVSATATAPAFIYYTLNCPTTATTVEILPSDAGGNPTGPAVRTENLGAQTRGKHTYIWPGVKDDGTLAPAGTYVARLTADANQAQWDPIVGIFGGLDPTLEYSARPLPGLGGDYWTGIAVDKDPNSPYYGRIYAADRKAKDIHMYDPDGAYIGPMNDSGLGWTTSAPWDIVLADDGYLYVGDRTNYCMYRFEPDGSGWYAPYPKVDTTYYRAMFARKDPSSGLTYTYATGMSWVKENRIEDPGLMTETWYDRRDIYPLDYTGNSYGLWVGADRTYLYQCMLAGVASPDLGVTKWTLDDDAGDAYPGPLDYTYTRTGWQNLLARPQDVEESPVNDPVSGLPFLWVTNAQPYSTTAMPGVGTRALYKLDKAAGTTVSWPIGAEDFDIITYGHMCAADAVGNIAITFGYSTPTWGMRYWGLFAPAGISQSIKKTSTFTLTANPAPVVVPGSASWAPDNSIAANDADTATVTFKILDANGWADITSATLDLQTLGYGAAVAVDSIVQDMGDLNGLTAIATKAGIKAKVGAFAGLHYLPATVSDAGGSNIDNTELQLIVTGHFFDGYVKHNRLTPGIDAMENAVIVAVGGGIPGVPVGHPAEGPFTYTSGLTDSSGYADMYLSAGNFNVHGELTGHGNVAPVNITSPYGGFPPDLFLRPLTVAEARASSDGGIVNVEGVCFAQPVGVAPTAAFGLDHRSDTFADPVYVYKQQWYMCDPNDPANGIMCKLSPPAFGLQWDDPAGQDMFGNSTYFGKRPAEGETIMITGLLDTIPSYERRVIVSDTDLINGMGALISLEHIYLNQGALGGLPPVPASFTIPQFAHGYVGTAYHPAWGQYGQVDNATVVMHVTDGRWVFYASDLGDTVPYALIADAAGNWASVTLQSTTSLNITWPNLGATYTFKGAIGRRARAGEGTIRPRKQADMVETAAAPGAPSAIGTVRSLPDATSVNVSGIVTAKWSTALYIEATDRSSGIRVQTSAAYPAVGDDLQVVGTLAMLDGERVINPTQPPIVLSSANTVPAALDLRSRAVGGVGTVNNPGVTNGRGALNVGLHVRYMGMVTKVNADPAYLYVWDGANEIDAGSLPVDDGTGNGPGVRIETTQGQTLTPWTEWVEITGIVSTAEITPTTHIIPTIIPTVDIIVTSAFDTITDCSLTANWNLIGLPAGPAGVGDGNEHSAKPWDPPVVFTGGDPWALDARMYRWESCNQGLYMWDIWSDDHTMNFMWGPFGGTVLGDGYWFNMAAPQGISYSGKLSDLDQWISICKPGWILIGHPKDTNIALEDVKVHDGAQVKTMLEASQWNANWLNSIGYWWNATTQGLVDIGLYEWDWPTTNNLQPCHGYWFQIVQGDKAFIIPEVSTYVPPW